MSPRPLPEVSQRPLSALIDIPFETVTPVAAPPYEAHHEDDLFTGNSVEHSQSNTPFQPILQPAPPISPIHPTGPITLTIDGGLIYPPPPSSAIYSLPRSFGWAGNEIFLQLSKPLIQRCVSDAANRDMKLYVIRRTPFTNEIALVPQRMGFVSGVMRGRRSIRGRTSWDIEIRDRVALRYSRGKWKDDLGNILAWEGGNKEHDQRIEVYGGREEITITAAGRKLELTDLIVAAWCARLWRENAKPAPLMQTLFKGR
ncbi:hypothetical protein LTS18_003598, partial [Coniosporium uncinatum]